MKKNLKQGLSIFMLSVFIFSLSSIGAYAETYSDWALPEIMAANYSDISIYYGDFDFTKNITRRDFAFLASKLITRKENLPWEFYGENEMNLDTPFSDINKNENADDKGICILYNAGIISGVDDTHFAPDESITREQAAKILTLLIGNLTSSDFSSIQFSDDLSFLSDEPLVSSWAKQYVWFVMQEKIMNGTGNNCFSPRDNITYEQAISICYRIADKHKLHGIVPVETTNRLNELQLFSQCGACWKDNYVVYYPVDNTKITSVKVLSAKINGDSEIASVEKIDVEAYPEFAGSDYAADFLNTYRINSSVPFENIVYFELELEICMADGTVINAADCFTWEVTGLGGMF